MDQKIEKIFEANRESILTKAKELFGLTPSEPQRLGSFESIVFMADRLNKPVILRITDSIHRTANEIRGELEWIDYLAEGGASAARPQSSRAGNLVETVDINRNDSEDRFYFSLTVFDRAPGRLIEKEDWGRDLFVRWGRTIGRIHALSRDYQPSRPETKRRHWYDDDDIKLYKYLPDDQGLVIEKWMKLLERMDQFPVNENIYGMTHNDIHHGNLFIDNDRITVFDFGDCQYNWYVNDLAISMFYLIQDTASGDNKGEFAKSTFAYLLEGYQGENSLPTDQLGQIGDFLKFREIMLYLIVYAEEAFELNGWCRRYMEGRREKIENDVPFVDVEFG